MHDLPDSRHLARAAAWRRAPIVYYGGKGKLLGFIVPLIPTTGARFVDVFGGGGSVFFAQAHYAPIEVFNDLCGDVIALMRALQNPVLFARLEHRLRYTLYSRAEFVRALKIRCDPAAAPIDRAWATFVTANQGFAGNAGTPGNWGRSFSKSRRCMAADVSGWQMRQRRLPAWHERLRRAMIDNRDFGEVIPYWDAADTVFYCDPPYVLNARSKSARAMYAHEMTDADHRRLLDLLIAAKGAVVLSGYAHPLYDDALTGWERHTRATVSHAAGRVRGSKLQGKGNALRHVPRTEVVWRNARAVEMCHRADLI